MLSYARQLPKHLTLPTARITLGGTLSRKAQQLAATNKSWDIISSLSTLQHGCTLTKACKTVHPLREGHFGIITIFADILVHLNGIASTVSQAAARQEGSVGPSQSLIIQKKQLGKNLRAFQGLGRGKCHVVDECPTDITF